MCGRVHQAQPGGFGRVGDTGAVRLRVCRRCWALMQRRPPFAPERRWPRPRPPSLAAVPWRLPAVRRSKERAGALRPLTWGPHGGAVADVIKEVGAVRHSMLYVADTASATCTARVRGKGCGRCTCFAGGRPGGRGGELHQWWPSDLPAYGSLQVPPPPAGRNTCRPLRGSAWALGASALPYKQCSFDYFLLELVLQFAC